MTTPLLFTILGPLFLLLALWRGIGARRLTPQAKTWLILGILFSLVAAWLWWHQPGTH